MGRRRFLYTVGGVPLPEPVEVSDDFQATPERNGNNFIIDRYMEGTVSPVDGSDIGSRAKRREHMKAHGLADADDYKGTWAKAAKDRENAVRNDRPRRVEAIRKAMYDLNSRRR